MFYCFGNMLWIYEGLEENKMNNDLIKIIIITSILLFCLGVIVYMEMSI
jgi:hypothetical protein